MKMEQEFNGIIYRANNTINDKSYIGITTNSIKQRQLDHIERALRGEPGKFYEAISKYGEDVFAWEQIDTASDRNQLAAKEKLYVLTYNTKEDGYNSDSGGGIQKAVYQYDLKTKGLIASYPNLSAAASIINMSKQDISRACLNVNNQLGGYYWSYEKCDCFIPSRDLRKKIVVQLDLEDNFVAHYKSVSEAAENTGLSKTCISRVCRGERESTRGYKFKYII